MHQLLQRRLLDPLWELAHGAWLMYYLRINVNSQVMTQAMTHTSGGLRA
jgi:hypothetical protein